MKATTKQMINDYAAKVAKDLEYKKTLAQRIYDANQPEVVEPGYYDVIEHDENTWMGTKKMTIEITEHVNMKDLAVMLLHEKNYCSPWLYLVLRKHEIKTNFKY